MNPSSYYSGWASRRADSAGLDQCPLSGEAACWWRSGWMAADSEEMESDIRLMEPVTTVLITTPAYREIFDMIFGRVT